MGGSRRTRGEGTPKQLPSGLWRWRIKREGRTIDGPARPTKDQARLALLAKLAEPSAATSHSFGTFARAWVSTRRLAPLTAERYEEWITLIERDPLGSKPMRKITEADLTAWISRQHYAAATLRNRISFIHSVLRAAGNPARAQLPKRDHRRRPLSPRERKVLDGLLGTADPETRLALLLMSRMGLRREEALGLRHEDRDGKGVWIQRTVTVTKKNVHIREVTKSANGYRWVPLAPGLEEVGKGKGFVLGRGSRPLHPKTLSDRVRRLFAGTELEKVPYAGGHALRRTYGQQLLEGGVDPVTAAALMGHDPAMLMKEYSRSREDLKISAVKKVFGKTSGGTTGGTKAAQGT